MKALITAIAITLIPLPVAAASPSCGRYEATVEYLDKDFSQTKAGRGMDHRGYLVELFTADDGGWTMLFTRADGFTCILAEGWSWERFDNTAKGEPS